MNIMFGIAMFVTDETVRPDELGVLAEQRGFESLFVPEHTHIPLSRRTPHPRGELKEYYKRTLDPFVALTAAACATSHLLWAPASASSPKHDPIVTAKEVATLDISQRRPVRPRRRSGLERGRDAQPRHAPRAPRCEVMRERVVALSAIWTNDEAEFHGNLVDFDPIGRGRSPRSTAPADPPGRRRTEGARSRARVRRWVGAEPAGARRPGGALRRAPAPGCRRRTGTGAGNGVRARLHPLRDRGAAGDRDRTRGGLDEDPCARGATRRRPSSTGLPGSYRPD